MSDERASSGSCRGKEYMGKVISVFGSSQVGAGSRDYKEARLLGRLLAEAGFTQETFIRPQDFALLRVVETAKEAVETLSGFFGA